MDRPKSFFTTPVAILIGCSVISLAILMSGGIIKVGSKVAGVKTDAAQPSTPPAQQAAPAQPSQTSITLDQVKNALKKSVVKFGDQNSKLTVIEIADPSCPYCSAAAGLNPALNKQMGAQFTLVADGGTYVAPVPELEKLAKDGKAAFAWIYAPGHGNGEMGTKALYCAFEKNKFWEAHDLLMSTNGYDLLNNKVKNDKTKSGDVADFLQAAVDSSFMKQCLDSGKYDSKLNDDVALAGSLGISGTPGFLVNTTPFRGAYSYKEMESAVKTALGT